MIEQIENLEDLSVIEELKWAEHITQTNKLRKSKCLNSPHVDYNLRVTVWRPRSLQNTRIKTPFQRKLTPGHTVINRSILTAREHIQLLAIPKRLVYDPHTLKPVKRSLRSCCPPRVAELSVPKKDRVYCTWTQYHHRLAPAKVDRLYELMTLEIPNRSKAGTRFSHRVKLARTKNPRRKSETREHIFEYTIHQIATCCAVRMSDWICCQIGRKLNKEQMQIAYHIKINLEKTSTINSDSDNLLDPIKLCAMIVYKILHQVNCSDNYYTSDNMISDSKSNVQSDDQYRSSKHNSDDAGMYGKGPGVFNKGRIPYRKSTPSARTMPDESIATSAPQKSSAVEEMVEDSIAKEENELSEKESSIAEEKVSITKSSTSNADNFPILGDNEEKQIFIPKEDTLQTEKEDTMTRPSPSPNPKDLKTKDIVYNLVPVCALAIKAAPSTSTSRICNFSDELNCLCKEIYCKLDIISSDLHNFDTMPHASNTVCCASVKAWARFLGEVAETAKTWCYWITKTVKRMRKIARILKGDNTYCCGCRKRQLSYCNYRKWLNFFEKLDCDIGRWRTYNNHVQDISEEIISHYKNKSVECCELCKQEYYDVTQLSVRHVCKQLMDALNASKYWREWLGEMVDECESLTKLITKDEGSLIKLSMSDYEMRKHKCNFQPFQGSIYSISEINV